MGEGYKVNKSKMAKDLIFLAKMVDVEIDESRVNFYVSILDKIPEKYWSETLREVVRTHKYKSFPLVEAFYSAYDRIPKARIYDTAPSLPAPEEDIPDSEWVQDFLREKVYKKLQDSKITKKSLYKGGY